MAAKNAVCKKVIGSENVAFQFANGQVLRCNVADVPESIRDRLALAGIAHTIGDTYAGADGDASWAYDQARDRWDRMCAGEWTRRAQATGPRIDMEALAEALRRYMDRQGDARDVDACREVINSQSEESVKALHKGRLSADYLEIMAERARERAEAAGDDDLSALFD